MLTRTVRLKFMYLSLFLDTEGSQKSINIFPIYLIHKNVLIAGRLWIKEKMKVQKDIQTKKNPKNKDMAKNEKGKREKKPKISIHSFKQCSIMR